MEASGFKVWATPPPLQTLTPFPFLPSPMLLRLPASCTIPWPSAHPPSTVARLSNLLPPPLPGTPIRIPSANPEPSPLSSFPLTNDAAAADDAVRDVGFADDTARSNNGVLDLHVVQL